MNPLLNLPIAPGGGGGSGGSGDVVGPASSTDNAIVRYDGTTGKLLQNSSVTIDDSNVVSGATQLNVDNLRLDGNTLSSTDTNGNIVLDPDGTGNTSIASGNLVLLSGTAITSTADDYICFGGGATGSGSKRFCNYSNVLSFGSGHLISWKNSTDANGGTSDSGFARSSAGVVKVTDGSSGNGALQVGNLNLATNTISSTNTNGDINLDTNGTGIVTVDGDNSTAGTIRLASFSYIKAGPFNGELTFGNTGVHSTSSLYFDNNNQHITVQSGFQYSWSSSATNSTASKDTGLARSAAGVIKATDGSTGIRGFLGGGTSVASAAAMPLPTGRVFHVTGTTNITSITSTNFQSGAVITLIFDDVLTFTDGNNLKLAGNFVTSADDTITLVYDGTNWFETSRSVN